MPSDKADLPPKRWALGPLGERLTLDKLPPPTTRRWVIRRKAELVYAVRGGLLTYDEVLRRYDIGEEEFEAWHRSVERHGLSGLRGTRTQHYRDREKRFPDL